MRGKTSTGLTRRAIVGAALSGTAALLATVALPTPRATASSPSLPPLDPTALQAAIGDLEHPLSTAAQLRVGGTAGTGTALRVWPMWSRGGR